MVDCFIKKIFNEELDEAVHSQFVRFSKGLFENKAVINLHITSKIKVKGTYEYSTDFLRLASELGGGKVSGVVFKKLGNKIGKQEINKDLTSSELKELIENSYCILADVEAHTFFIKMKKKLPRPSSKAESKVDDKFCQLESDLKHKEKIKESFFWDIGDCKKVRILHDYEITDIIRPKNEKDFEKIRILSKRKGKLTRRIEVDGVKERKEKDIEV
ncbi:MAG: hypothetical protein ABIE22_02070 [archaeon]